MICPHCYGRRVFSLHGTLIPCPTCEGFGELHCCDGLQAQPTSDGEGAPPPARLPGQRPVSMKVAPVPPAPDAG